MSEEQKAPNATPYRVLARKYRPQNFAQLIGQDALVRTLKNAIESGRIAHAFMLTGVRGVGKTTTARIIAKALNYTGPDGQSGPTTGATEDCALCRAISEDRHPDVIEMDAASRTGIDDIREILDDVRYAPSEARYKIYIIDEVHMLSKPAFNALLKTLEEPPPHVKFIFATTEIHKVPITVLSRCQRFDLRRVDIPTLTAHYLSICQQEQVKIAPEAAELIAQAADGSVRDGLSILDQAIALTSTTEDTASITAQDISQMLGLADRSRNLDLLEFLLSGKIPEALTLMDDLYRKGADPVILIQDLLDLNHTLTKLRAVPETKTMSHTLSTGDGPRTLAFAQKTSLPLLGRTWQMLLKGLGEVQQAPNPQNALEMVLIRLGYAADLPDPADLIRKLQDNTAPSATGSGTSLSRQTPDSTPRPTQARPALVSSGATHHAIAYDTAPQPAPAPALERPLATLQDLVFLLEQHNEMLLASQLYQFVHLIKLEHTAQAGRLDIRLATEAPPKLSQELSQTLGRLTAVRWLVSLSAQSGQPTLAQRAEQIQQAEIEAVRQHPLIQEIYELFPDAEIKAILSPQAPHDT